MKWISGDNVLYMNSLISIMNKFKSIKDLFYFSSHPIKIAWVLEPE
jgi:hypothetical protein